MSQRLRSTGGANFSSLGCRYQSMSRLPKDPNPATWFTKLNRTVTSVYGRTAVILLGLNTLAWFMASLYADDLLDNDAISEFWPLMTYRGPYTSTTNFEMQFSIEELLIFVLVPWIVVYLFKRPKTV